MFDRFKTAQSSKTKVKHVYRRAEIIALIISAVLCVLSVVLVTAVGFAPGFIVFTTVLAIVLWFLYAVTMQAAYEAIQVKPTEKWRWDVPKPDFSNLSDRDFDDMRVKIPEPSEGIQEVELQDGTTGIPYLDCLMWASVRRHWFFLFMRILPVVLIALLVGIFSIMLAKHAPWWLLPLVLVLAGGVIAYEYVEWWMTRWDLTPTQFRVIKRPPAWLPFLDDSVEPFPLSNMTASEGSTMIGRELGYGTLRLKTLYQDAEDKDVAVIPGMPYYAEIAAAINKLTSAR